MIVLNKGTTPKYLYFYNVTVRVAANSDAVDMAKNIIASFTSLIAAICGFYFGSAASKQSADPQKSTNPTQTPKIIPKSPIPTTGKKGQLMTFEWDIAPPGQQIKVQATSDTNQPVVDSSNLLKFTYTPSITGKVTLKVYLINNPYVFQDYQIDISE